MAALTCKARMHQGGCSVSATVAVAVLTVRTGGVPASTVRTCGVTRPDRARATDELSDPTLTVPTIDAVVTCNGAAPSSDNVAVPPPSTCSTRATIDTAGAARTVLPAATVRVSTAMTRDADSGPTALTAAAMISLSSACRPTATYPPTSVTAL